MQLVNVVSVNHDIKHNPFTFICCANQVAGFYRQGDCTPHPLHDNLHIWYEPESWSNQSPL